MYLSLSDSTDSPYLSPIENLVKVMFAVNCFLLFAVLLKSYQQYTSKNYEYYSELVSSLESVSRIIMNSNGFKFIEFKQIQNSSNPILKPLAYFLLEKVSFIPVPAIGYRILNLHGIYSLNN